MRFEDHLLSLDINIKQVFIQSKTASSLSFEVKNNQNNIFKTQKYALQNEHSLIYEHCQIQITANFDNDSHTYTPQEITITVLLQQQAGSSVGGLVKFNPFSASFQEKDWELPLENSLPNSKIIFTSRLQLISKKQRLTKTKQSFAQDPYNLKKSNNLGKESKHFSKKSSMNDMILPESKIKPNKDNISSRYKEFGGLPNKTKKLESARSGNIQKEKTKPGSPRFTEQTTQKTKLVDEVQKLKKKIEEQRAEKVRSISKLKMEINPKILQGDVHPPDSDVGKLKEKIRNLERKQRNLQIAIQDLTKDLERNKEKQNLLERRKQELERVIGEKDIKLRAANNTIRTLNEQIDSLSSRERIVSKKGQVKETIFKDQTKRLEERLKQAEVEVTLAINEKNQMIKTITDLQKKHQVILKERDLKFSEEKSKNLKLREELVSQQKDLEIKLEEISIKNSEVTQLNILYQERIHQLEISVVRYENQISGLKESLKKQKQNLESITAELEKNQGQELLSMKKRNNELNSENVSTKEKIKKYEKDLEESENRIRQLEENLKAKIIQSQKHMTRLNNFQKELDSTKEQVNRKTTELEYSKSTINTLTMKIADSKEKLQNEKNRREDSNYELERTSSIFKQQKDELEAEISQLKWTIIKNNDIMADLEQKLRSSGEQNLKLSEEIMAKSQRIISLEENNKILSIDNDHLIKQKNTLTLKIREQMELLKQKQSQLEEEKKSRLRLEQKYEEEKQRVNQLELSNKNREAQQEKKLKEKEEQIKLKSQEFQDVQLQLFKKNEEVLTLKANNQMTLRQMQLTKSEYDGVKGQLNLLQAENTSFKDQNGDLKSQLQEISNQCMLVKEKLTMTQNKIQSLKNQHDEYVQSVRLSFQNLVNELFKEQNNWNVIATTLIPFPDETLSSLQIKLVQKRNNFMIKQKQLNTSNEHQINTMQDQIKNMKIMFDSRQAQSKKQDNEEREKLKYLLYEGMLEKNHLVEEMNNLTQQKEEVLKEMERLKRQIIRREESQDELSGQLQLLLLEHDSLKVENQDLSNLIFKYREQEIRIRGQYQQRISQNREQSGKVAQKVKVQIIEKDKKIITLQKQIMEMEQKTKLAQAQKQHLKEELQTTLDKLKNAENKIIYCESQLTKLNNTIRNQEKIEAQNKEQIERFENDIRKYSFREESFNSNIASLQTDIMQTSIEKEKLNGDIQHLKERLEETQRIFSEKGETSKEKIQKKMEENAELKSRLIQKESELSMKEFILKQKEQQISSITTEKQELQKTITDLKSRIKDLSQAKDQSEMKIREHIRQIQRLEMEVHRTEQIVAKSNYTIMAMQNELDLMRTLQATLRDKEEQCIRLREQKAETDQNFIWEMKKYQENVILLKKQLEAEKGHQKNIKEEHKINISRSQSSNNQKYNNLLAELHQEKDEFEKRVSQIEVHNKTLIADLENKIENLREELAQEKEQEKILQQELTKRENQIISLQKKLKEIDKLYDEFKQRYNRYYLMYEQSKIEIEHLIKSNEQNLKKIGSQFKESISKTFNQKLGQLSKKIERIKYSTQTNLKKETYSKGEFNQQFQHLFNKLRQFILEAQIRESDSFDSKQRIEIEY